MDDFQSALTTLIGPGRESLASRWLHPALQQRLTFLHRAANEPRFAARFESRLRWIALSLVGLFAAAIAVALA
jgi:hypothetical protein